jgi:hypothetical protein
MTGFGLIFQHLGLAVKKPESAIVFVQGLGYHVGSPIFDCHQNVNLILCSHNTEPDIEIIYPGDGEGPIDNLVARHANGIIYHSCYVTKDIDKTLGALSNAGLRPVCVSSPKAAALFGGKKVSFYQVIGVGLIEILEDAQIESV